MINIHNRTQISRCLWLMIIFETKIFDDRPFCQPLSISNPCLLLVHHAGVYEDACIEARVYESHKWALFPMIFNFHRSHKVHTINKNIRIG